MCGGTGSSYVLRRLEQGTNSHCVQDFFLYSSILISKYPESWTLTSFEDSGPKLVRDGQFKSNVHLLGQIFRFSLNVISTYHDKGTT